MSSTPFNIFVLADCNNFYASCERLFNPWLEGRPIIVLSNNDGCVVARSQEAKRLGIKMGEPYFQIKDTCRRQGIEVYSSNYQLYGDLSTRVMEVLAQHAPEIEIYSIDEAFLKYPNTFAGKGMYDRCVALKRTVKKWVGLPISLGIGPTKTLAKVANDLAKKNRVVGVFDLSDPVVQQEVLQKYDVGEVWGIGRSTKEKLKLLGIRTAWQLRESDPREIKRKLGIVGERIVWELRGVSCLPLEEVAPKKSITCSRSFGKVVTELPELFEAIATYVHTAATKLRQQKCCASALCVYVEGVFDERTGTRRHEQAVISFSVATSDTPTMITAAKHCLSGLFREGEHYKKCGVVLLDLVPATQVISDLFVESPDPRRVKLMQTMDALNARFGKNKLFYAAMGIDPAWKMRSDSCSRHYTTDWNDLATAIA